MLMKIIYHLISAKAYYRPRIYVDKPSRTYQRDDLRHPESNSVYTHKTDDSYMDGTKESFDAKLFSNLDNELKKGPLVNRYYNKGFAEFEDVVRSKGDHEIRDVGTKKARRKVIENEMDGVEDNRASVNVRNKKASPQFNILDWLSHDDIEMDSEEELQRTLRIHKAAEAAEKKVEMEKAKRKKEDEEEKLKKRKRRFLRYAKNHLNE